MSNNSMKNLFLGFIEEQANRSKNSYHLYCLFQSFLSFYIEGTKTPLLLTVNGEQQDISTHANTVEELLKTTRYSSIQNMIKFHPH